MFGWPGRRSRVSSPLCMPTDPRQARRTRTTWSRGALLTSLSRPCVSWPARSVLSAASTPRLHASATAGYFLLLHIAHVRHVPDSKDEDWSSRDSVAVAILGISGRRSLGRSQTRGPSFTESRRRHEKPSLDLGKCISTKPPLEHPTMCLMTFSSASEAVGAEPYPPQGQNLLALRRLTYARRSGHPKPHLRSTTAR